MSAIAPLSYCYLSVVELLYTLIEVSVLEADFVKACVKQITAKVESQDCKYGKCFVRIHQILFSIV